MDRKMFFFLLGLILFTFLAVMYLPKIRIDKLLSINFVENDAPANCQKNPNPLFPQLITDLTKVQMITPPGSIEEGQQQKIMKTHAYIVVKERVPVYAPVDSDLYKGAFYTEEEMNQYSVFFNVSCEVYYMFDHIQEPVDKIKLALPQQPSTTTQTSSVSPLIAFKAGELIGYTTGTKNAHHFDFGVYNRTMNNGLNKSYPDINFYSRDYLAICPFIVFHQQNKDKYTQLFGNIRLNEPIPKVLCQ